MRCLADLLAHDQPLQLDPLAVHGRTCRWRRAGLVSGRQPLGGGRHTGRFGLTLFLRCTGAATQVVADVGHQDDNISVQLACIAALTRASPVLREQGFAPPPWAEVARGGRAAPRSGDGSVPLRPAWTRRPLGASYVTSIRHLAPSCCRKPALAGRELLLPYQPHRSSASPAIACVLLLFMPIPSETLSSETHDKRKEILMGLYLERRFPR